MQLPARSACPFHDLDNSTLAALSAGYKPTLHEDFPSHLPRTSTQANEGCPQSLPGGSSPAISTGLKQPDSAQHNQISALDSRFTMADGTIATILGGALAPIVSPFVVRLQQRVNRQRQVACSNPAIIFEYITHECHDLNPWIPTAKQILRKNKWVKSELWERTVNLHKIGAPLIAHGVWRVEDARFFENKCVEVVGPQAREKRMALILWGIHQGVLKATGSSGGAQGGGGASGSQAVGAAVVLRLQDAAGSAQARMAIFHPDIPEAGVPISVSKVIVPMTVDIRQRPTPTLLLSERAVRDLGTLMHDPRGAFEVEVQCSLSRSLSDIVGSLDRTLLPRDRAFEFALFDVVEWWVHAITCVTHDDHYDRPVRPSDWPYLDDMGSELAPDNRWWFDNHHDGDEAWSVNRLGRTLGTVSVNAKEKLPDEVRWAVAAWKLLGCPIEYEQHQFGLIWISWLDTLIVVLGRAELSDAKRYKDTLASTYSNGWNAAGARGLFLRGWHDGPQEEEEGEGWDITIYQEKGTLFSDLVGFNVLRGLPVNLC